MPSTASSSGSGSPDSALSLPARRVLALLVVVALGVAAGQHAQRIDDPWDASLGGVNSGSYCGYSALWFDHRGILASGGVPAILFHESEPDLTVPYVNHPPLPYLAFALAYRHLGRDEAALRSLALCGLAGLALGLGLFLRDAGGGPFASCVLLALAPMPVLAQYGRMIDSQVLVTATMSVTLLAWARLRRRLEGDEDVRGARRTLLVAASINALTEWIGYGAAAVAFVDAVFAPRARRGRLLRDATLLVGVPQIAGVVLHLSWLKFTPAPGDVDLLALFAKLREGNPGHAALTFADWPPVMAEWMHTAFGTGLLLLASLGFLHLLARPRGAPATRETWLLVGAGALPSLLFWRHAIVHEFWPLILAPGMACLAGRGSWVVLRAAGRRGPALVGAALLGLALVTALTVRDARALLERYDTTIFRDRGRALNEHVTAKDLVLVPGDLTADRFYTHAPMIPLLNDAAALETLRARYRGRIEGVDRVFIFWPRAWMEEGAWLKSVARESWLPIRWGDSDGILIETPRRSWD